MSNQGFEGGCQCKAIHYEIAGEPLVVAICHCATCRLANAAPAVAWAMFRKEQVRFTTGALKIYASSQEATRGFCPDCGTQITFEASYIPGLIDITVGSLDHPETIAPSLHCWDSKRLPWIQLADELPRYSEFPQDPTS